MPKIIRSMREAAGKPALGPRDLGVRVPPDLYADITPDAAGEVQPGTGGMSIAPDLRDLPGRLIPRRLRHLVPAAAGNDDRFIWGSAKAHLLQGRLPRDWRYALTRRGRDTALSNRNGR